MATVEYQIISEKYLNCFQFVTIAEMSVLLGQKISPLEIRSENDVFAKTNKPFDTDGICY